MFRTECCHAVQVSLIAQWRKGGDRRENFISIGRVQAVANGEEAFSVSEMPQQLDRQHSDRQIRGVQKRSKVRGGVPALPAISSQRFRAVFKSPA